MNFPPTSHGEPPTQSSDVTPPYGPVMDDGLAFPFTLYDPCALPPAHHTWQGGFRHPRFDPTEPRFATEGSSSFFATAHAPPPPVHFSTWNNALSGDIGQSMLSAGSSPSEPPIYAAQHPSGDNVCHAVVSSWLLLTSPPCRQVVVTGNQSASPREREHKIRTVFPSITVPELTGGQAIPAGSHPEHVVSWYQVHRDAVIVNGPRKFVPQTIYEPHAKGDKERYVSLAKLHPRITFLAQDSPEWGVPISHLLSKQPVRLAEGNEPAFVSSGPSIGIRAQVFHSFQRCLRQWLMVLQWPGYQPCHKQVSARDYRRERRMITKEKLAKVVAKCIKEFMDTMSRQPMQVGSDMRWRIGPYDIQVDDIILVSLHHVSQGSWQPQLRLRRTIGTNVVA